MQINLQGTLADTRALYFEICKREGFSQCSSYDVNVLTVYHLFLKSLFFVLCRLANPFFSLFSFLYRAKITYIGVCNFKKVLLVLKFTCKYKTKMAFLSRLLILLAILLYEQYIHHTQASLCPNTQYSEFSAVCLSYIFSYFLV